jgi:hypothetical protein
MSLKYVQMLCRENDTVPYPILIESLSRTADSRRDSKSSVERELQSPVIAGDEIIIGTDHTLPAHLMLLLKNWHRENPRVQPPGSYRKSPANIEATRYNLEIFSRTGERLSETYVFIFYPVQYTMLVLRSDHQPAKFVSCVRSQSRIFLKEWLGGHEYNARTCAVRHPITKVDGQPMITTEDMFKAADLKMPHRTARLGSGVIPSEHGRSSSSTATSYIAKTASTEQDTSDCSHGSDSEPISATVQRQRRRQQSPEIERSSSTQDHHPRGTIIFKLVTPEAARCFTVEPGNTGNNLFKKCCEFFWRIDREVTVPILVCKIPGEEKLRYLFDGKEMNLLLRSVRERVTAQGELTVVVEYEH